MALIASTTLLAFVSLIALPARQRDPAELAAAGILVLGLCALVGLASRTRSAEFPRRLVPFGLFAAIALLRDGAGGSASGFAPLVLFPVLWLALYENTLNWIAGAVCACLVIVVPVLAIGAPRYANDGWRRALFLTMFAALLGFTVSRWRGAHEQAVTDRLTGVPNRRLWDEMLPRLVAQAKRNHKPLSVAIVDFDHFKAYNDTLGHQAGDHLLHAAAMAWARQLREGDLLARYGGEEFAIALHDCRADQALEVVNRVRSATPEGQTCSAGIATLADDEPLHELIARADAALYEAKRDRNRTVLHR
jgi:diguanylate cyclase (GGDEF)-like protein